MNETPLDNKIKDLIKNAFKTYMVKDYRESIRILKAAEVLDKDNPEILYNLGIFHSHIGLNKTAISYFKKVLDLKSTFIEFLTVKKLLAYLYIQKNDFNIAINYLDEVLSVMPLDSISIQLKGFSYEKKGEFKKAIAEYEKIIKLDNNNFNAYNSLAYLFTLTGKNNEKAMEYAQKAYKSNKSNPAYLDTLGYIYLKNKDTENAKKYLYKASAVSNYSEEIKLHIRELSEYSPPLGD